MGENTMKFHSLLILTLCFKQSKLHTWNNYVIPYTNSNRNLWHVIVRVLHGSSNENAQYQNRPMPCNYLSNLQLLGAVDLSFRRVSSGTTTRSCRYQMLTLCETVFEAAKPLMMLFSHITRRRKCFWTLKTVRALRLSGWDKNTHAPRSCLLWVASGDNKSSQTSTAWNIHVTVGSRRSRCCCVLTWSIEYLRYIAQPQYYRYNYHLLILMIIAGRALQHSFVDVCIFGCNDWLNVMQYDSQCLFHDFPMIFFFPNEI